MASALVPVDNIQTLIPSDPFIENILHISALASSVLEEGQRVIEMYEGRISLLEREIAVLQESREALLEIEERQKQEQNKSKGTLEERIQQLELLVNQRKARNEAAQHELARLEQERTTSLAFTQKKAAALFSDCHPAVGLPHY